MSVAQIGNTVWHNLENSCENRSLVSLPTRIETVQGTCGDQLQFEICSFTVVLERSRVISDPKGAQKLYFSFFLQYLYF